MINLNQQNFTALPVEQLPTWVIWQFPQETNDGFLCAAVRSTEAGSLWWPACIDTTAQKVYLLSEADPLFATPEEAVAFLKNKFTA